MKYYKIWVTAASYKGKEPLTYSSEINLHNGSIAIVPFRDRQCPGLVETETEKPSFKVKEIYSDTDLTLPKALIDLFKWSLAYYPGSPASHLQLLLPTNVFSIKRGVLQQEDKKLTSKPEPPALTSEQSRIIKAITNSSKNVILLHGDTGTGKTRVYIEMIKKSLEENRSAIVLTPEIGLTSQLVSVLDGYFPGKVLVMHSKLSAKQKFESWLRIINTREPIIVVGPRSALFTPIERLGIIVIDEAHESSYKQEQSPNYQATRVAAKLAQIQKAKLIMGTATPVISDYFLLKSKGSLVLRMQEPAIPQGPKPHKYEISVVKLNDRTEFNKSYWLSDKLIESIKKSLSDSEQSLIFLNRRGTSLLILCSQCGWRALCPNCDTALTYHSDTHSMLCHSCSFRGIIPSNCPICNNKELVFKGAGTKLITEELLKLFPLAKIQRFDKDNHKGERVDEHYEQLVSGSIDILVGTQILTKGFDLPKLSTVGVVFADSSLNFPDYTAEERTFQALSQVIGRVRRGHRDGRVVVQTYSPDSLAIEAAIDNDYDEFYKQQLTERKQFNFPPFCYLLILSCRSSTRAKAQASCTQLINKLRLLNLPIEINGPSPAFSEKIANKYAWQIILKAHNRQALLDVIEIIPPKWSYNIDPVNLL
jgi:primosomal protein N' (replication factor Y)